MAASQSLSQRPWLFVLLAGGLCIVMGAALPWASADGVVITALSHQISLGATLYGLLVVVTGVAAVAIALVARLRGSNRVLAIVGTAVAALAVGWSLIFPALVDVEQQDLGGPLQISYGPGAYFVAVGVVAVTIGAGLSFLPRRGRRALTILVAAIAGGALAAALR